MSRFETLIFTIEDGLATITLNQPDKLNAISTKMKAEMLTAVREAGAPGSGVRALMITGAGRGFCAGADLSEGGVGGTTGDPGANLVDSYHPVFLELAHLDMPVITAVNGVAAGAGMSLALTADIVIAARSAFFLQAFVNIGLVPDAGSTYLLPRLVGEARAKAMMMLGERIPAEQAADWGLIYQVVDDAALTETATTMAQRLAKGPTRALSHIRHLVAASAGNGYESQLQAEALAQRAAGRTDDSREGVQAFLEKRPAAFTGT